MSAPSPDLSWSEAGEPRSGRFGDVYFSADDGLAESRAVFLGGCGLPEAWAGRDHFVVAELGFGTGLNIVALLDLWRRARPTGGHLNIFSVEAFPLSVEEAGRALSAWPGVADAARALLAAWPRRTPGFHRIDLPGFHAVIDLAIGDAAESLTRWSGRADAWFLDGFSPALNPEMWSDAVLDAVAARSAPGARLATFTVAGAVRRGLSERGFTVAKRPGHGRKRERLEAVFQEESAPTRSRLRLDHPPLKGRENPFSVAVIGAGIAGAATAKAVANCGLDVVLVAPRVTEGMASGFPAALVTPRIDSGDNGLAGLFAQALERAGDLYRAVPGAVIAQGVTQLAQAPRDAARFAKVAAQPLWTEGEMSAAGEGDAAALTMASALTIRPRTILDAWLDGVRWIEAEAAVLEPVDGRWNVLDAAGAVLATVDRVVVAGGWGSAALMPDLDLRPVRGQADWVEGLTAPATAWGGYVAPTPDGLLFGATHDRGDTGIAPRAADSDRNLQTLAARFPDLAARVAELPRQTRAAVRATTFDRMPLCGPVDGREGVFVLTGLGSRGFCAAPLLAEHLAAEIAGRPSPLPRDIAARLNPARRGRKLAGNEAFSASTSPEDAR